MTAPVVGRWLVVSDSVRLGARATRGGDGESEVDQRIAPIYMRHDDVQTRFLPRRVKFRSIFDVSRNATDGPEAAPADFRKHRAGAGEAVSTTEGESMEEVVARELTIINGPRQGESCTGVCWPNGLTRISGGAAYFLGGGRLLQQRAQVRVVVSAREGDHRVACAQLESRRSRRRHSPRTGGDARVGITGVAGPTAAHLKTGGHSARRDWPTRPQPRSAA